MVRSIMNCLGNNKFCYFLLFVRKRFVEVRIPSVAASLTFTTLLSLVPIFTVVLAVMSAFPVFEQFSNIIVRFIQMTIVPQGADTILSYLFEFKKQAAHLTTIGMLFLGVTSLLLIHTIDETFNRIWRVQTHRPMWFQFLLYWALLTFAPLALGASLTMWGLLLQESGFAHLPFIGEISSILVNTVILSLLYCLVPNRHVPWQHALLAAGITSVFLEMARFAFTLYFASFDGYQLIYGAFAAVPIFLIWLKLLWIFILTGAVFTASLSYWKDEAFLRDFSSKSIFQDLLAVLLLLYQAQQDGKSLSIQVLRQNIKMGYDELGDLLDKLAKHDLVYQGKSGWVLKTDAQHIQLINLFQWFVYTSHDTHQDINQACDALLHSGLPSLHISLSEFAQQLASIHASKTV